MVRSLSLSLSLSLSSLPLNSRLLILSPVVISRGRKRTRRIARGAGWMRWSRGWVLSSRARAMAVFSLGMGSPQNRVGEDALAYLAWDVAMFVDDFSRAI